MAGKTAQFTLTVKGSASPTCRRSTRVRDRVRHKSGRVEDLRAEVESNLKLELKRKLEAVLKEQAMKALREKAQLTLPKSLVDLEAVQLMRRTAANLEQKGMKPEDIKLTPDLFRPQAEERVALGLILSDLVPPQNLQAKPEQVKAMVQEIAQTYEQPEAVVRWHYEKPERTRGLRKHGDRAERRRMGARQGAGEGRADVIRGADGAFPTGRGVRSTRRPQTGARRRQPAERATFPSEVF